MQLVLGEDRHVQLWSLLSPFLLFAFPAMAVVAAMAVFFETIPFLRGGFGNVAYFFVWTAGLSVPLATGKHASDLIGISVIADSARNAAGLSPQDGGVTFSLSFGQIASPVSTFRWDGAAWTTDIILVAYLAGVRSLPSWWCRRFCLTALTLAREKTARSRGLTAGTHVGGKRCAAEATVATLTPLVAGQTHSRFLAMVTAELRLMLKGLKWWWFLGAVGLLIASAAIPSAEGRGAALAFAWIWPVLLWSSMGVRETRDQTYQMIFRRRILLRGKSPQCGSPVCWSRYFAALGLVCGFC